MTKFPPFHLFDAGLNKTTSILNPTGLNRPRPTTDFISLLIV